ncbi:MAG: hypothetical protein J6J86_10535 [Lachnospiraceae bacterium]|nr:hypothetical protein [Lachnospiraceae bacterium]
MRNIVSCFRGKALILLVSCLALSACATKPHEAEQSGTTYQNIAGDSRDEGTTDVMSRVSAARVTELLGMSRSELQEIFGELLETTELSEASSNYSLSGYALTQELLYNDVSVQAALEFENEKLFRVQYYFRSENEAAFSFAQEAYTLLVANYGESDTYETMPDRVEGLTLEEYLKNDEPDYQEYWIGSEVSFEGMLLEEYKDSKRIDLGIGIKKLPMKESTETVVYIGGIVNSADTKAIK